MPHWPDLLGSPPLLLKLLSFLASMMPHLLTFPSTSLAFPLQIPLLACLFLLCSKSAWEVSRTEAQASSHLTLHLLPLGAVPSICRPVALNFIFPAWIFWNQWDTWASHIWTNPTLDLRCLPINLHPLPVPCFNKWNPHPPSYPYHQLILHPPQPAHPRPCGFCSTNISHMCPPLSISTTTTPVQAITMTRPDNSCRLSLCFYSLPCSNPFST